MGMMRKCKYDEAYEIDADGGGCKDNLKKVACSKKGDQDDK